MTLKEQRPLQSIKKFALEVCANPYVHIAVGLLAIAAISLILTACGQDASHVTSTPGLSPIDQRPHGGGYPTPLPNA